MSINWTYNWGRSIINRVEPSEIGLRNKADLEPEEEISQGVDTVDNSYATRNKEPLSVLSDDAPVENPDATRQNRDSDIALGRVFLPIIVK